MDNLELFCSTCFFASLKRKLASFFSNLAPLIFLDLVNLVVMISVGSINTFILFRLICDFFSASTKHERIESIASFILIMIELCMPFVFFLEKPISCGNSPLPNEKMAHLRF